MGAISTYANWQSAVNNPHQILQYVKTQLNGLTGNRAFGSIWSRSPGNGSAPGAAAVPAQNIAGAIGQTDPTGGNSLWLTRMQAGFTGVGAWVLCDRLSHQSGLDGTVATAQTTNLPTAALTRYTDGVGVFAAFEVYTALGATPQTITATYTNDAGGTSTSQAVATTGMNNASCTVVMALAQGDRGVRAISDVTLSGSTGTAGNFGVTLFKPLAMFCHSFPQDGEDFNGLIGACGNIPQIVNGACLYLNCILTNVSNGGAPFAFSFAEA